MLRKLLATIFPVTCLTCKKQLVKTEEWFCTHCEINFDSIITSDSTSEELAQLFWGKAQVNFVYAPYYFYKKENLQRIIHEFKYNKNKKLAITMGRKIAEQLTKKNALPKNTVVTFVPMANKKQKKRGYNQAEELARGFSNKLNFPLLSLIRKVKNTESQTDKGVYERYLNMHNIFEVVKNSQHTPHTIALIDDVITTGATLATCAKVLNKAYPEAQIVVIALAMRRLES